MSDQIISYIEMCHGEKSSLQAGMNFGLGGNHSVILMSVRPGAPYRDRLQDGGPPLFTKDTINPVMSAQTPNLQINSSENLPEI